MVITREIDYALRILKALRDGDLHPVGEISQGQLVPQAFAYKILKKLEHAGYVAAVRGAAGGYQLAKDLHGSSLYDLMDALGERSDLSACMDPDYQCPLRERNCGCKVHCRLQQIQAHLDEELRSHTLWDILG